MKLYPRNPDVSVINHPDGDFKIAKAGYFELPDHIAGLLHSSGGAGNLWETQGEHSTRMVVEEEERKNSPSALYELLQKLVSGPGASDAAPTPAQLRDQAAALLAAADAADGKKQGK